MGRRGPSSVAGAGDVGRVGRGFLYWSFPKWKFCIFGLKIFQEWTRVAVWVTEGASGLEAVLPCGNEAARILRVWGLKIKFERVIAGNGIRSR